MAGRAAPHIGITRVADITRLDIIGIPTNKAVLPLSRTLAVSQANRSATRFFAFDIQRRRAQR